MEFEYQHLVPRTYYKPWEKNDGSRKLRIVDVNSGEKKEKSSKREFGRKDFYTINIDNFYIFNEEDKKKIYPLLDDYHIRYDGKLLNTIDEYHSNFHTFEFWEIHNENGIKISNDVVYSILQGVRILDLENNWSSKVEQDWNSVVSRIENCVFTNQNITSNDYDFLYLYLASQKIRMEKFREEYIAEPIQNVFKNVLKPPSNPHEEQYISKMYDSIYKSIIRDFQNSNNDNKTVEAINTYIEKFSMTFLISQSKPFFTSDNPVCYNVSDKVPIKFRGQMFPLTPNILVIGYLGSKSNNQYYVYKVNDSQVDEINQYIKNNAIEKYIVF